ncbi:hypothetical protein [Microbacterium sp. cx-59]|uniref:hypothetical protein n=1 Tax=Microbacterium sp. cx-59 TaxID=2891207 RepID=UPI001E5C1630|nr:hypothetical protein [Microbacterium sp. cx-59]MCC4909797.1 hypothetical protein [Microbacterium sp. cx-59]
MKLSIKKAAAAGLAVALGLTAAGFGSTAASAAVGDWTPNGTPQPYFIYSTDTGEVVKGNNQAGTGGTVLKYTSGLVAAPSETDPEQWFADAPAEAEDAYVFIAPVGKESTISGWSSRVSIGFAPGKRGILQPFSSLFQFPAASFAAVKSAGGDYSLGYAYTKNNGVTFVGLGAYTTVHITAGTADWTYDYPTAITGQPPVDPNTTGQVAIEAPVAAPVNGALSLSVPTGAKATLGAAALNSSGQSVSTGTLPTFQVTDKRYVTKPGWTVNTSVAAFASGTNTLEPSVLSIAPSVAATSTSTGVTKVASLLGSVTAGTFAEAAAGAGTGVTDLSAALTLTAPLGTPAGTYTSTLTVTAVSK